MAKDCNVRPWKRARRFNKHHILAVSRGGHKSPQNIIRMDENRHSAFHLLFGTRTFYEAAMLLLRADKMKKRRK